MEAIELEKPKANQAKPESKRKSKEEPQTVKEQAVIFEGRGIVMDHNLEIIAKFIKGKALVSDPVSIEFMRSRGYKEVQE